MEARYLLTSALSSVCSPLSRTLRDVMEKELEKMKDF